MFWPGLAIFSDGLMKTAMCQWINSRWSNDGHAYLKIPKNTPAMDVNPPPPTCGYITLSEYKQNHDMG